MNQYAEMIRNLKTPEAMERLFAEGPQEGIDGRARKHGQRVLEWGAIAFSHIYSQACLNH